MRKRAGDDKSARDTGERHVMARGTRAGNAVRGPALRVGLGILLLAGCDDGGSFSLLQPRAGGQGTATEDARAARPVGRDVEAPEVFQATDMGLWDGRPSLGGVWVAHPDVTEPARVIIRNTADGSFVIGALFRRQRDMPGPVFQVSSDAAVALGLLAGSPQQLDVTALRREEAPAGAAAAEAAEAADGAPQGSAAMPEPAPASGAERAGASLARRHVRLGETGVEETARDAATVARQVMMVPMMVPLLRDRAGHGTDVGRARVGPAGDSAVPARAESSRQPASPMPIRSPTEWGMPR